MIYKKENKKAIINYFLEKVKKTIRKLKKLGKKYPLVFQWLQLSILYFYATVTLMYSVINCLGMFPETLYRLVPFTKEILAIPAFRLLATPEKTFLIYLGAVEIILNGKSTSLLVKYNFLLVFILEMVENLIISLWDLFSHRDMDILVGDIDFSLEWSINFFTFFFIVFFFIYLFCYYQSMKFKFASFPKPFNKITDSIGFWLNIKKDNKKERRSQNK